MKNSRVFISAFLAFQGFSGGVYSQTESGIESSRRIDPLKNYWGDLDGFFNRQAEATLALVEEALVRFPPVLPEPLERRMVLLMIDAVLHDVAAPSRQVVQEFFHSRMEGALQTMARTQVKEGAVIWKLYDHGFVIRTPKVTLAFDLVRGYSSREKGFPISDHLIENIVRQCDVLFVSHRHQDHADQFVAQSFIDQGKPVVAPLEVWAGEPIHERITHLKRESHKKQPLSIQNGEQLLDVVLYPGHQGEDIFNNVTLVFTPDGMSFVQTGDQSNSNDFEWIDEVSKHYHVDLLLPNCWTTDISRMIRGFDPELVIPGHENELGHSVDHREPYWLTYDRLQETDTVFLLMTWGEAFHYRPTALQMSK
jgi:L-ascorbate metabolism protein UlaG (beta-lactamase superfamily)